MNRQETALAVVTLLLMNAAQSAGGSATQSDTESYTNTPPGILAAATGTVVVTVAELQSTEGLLYASLYISDAGFPDVLDKAFANQAVPATEARDGAMVLTFDAIPAGPFAISVFHDANSDGKLDTNFLGIPKERYGFSQNPAARFGPPAFDKAAAPLAAGETQQLVITLK